VSATPTSPARVIYVSVRARSLARLLPTIVAMCSCARSCLPVDGLAPLLCWISWTRARRPSMVL
jgi:hypothetical protein